MVGDCVFVKLLDELVLGDTVFLKLSYNVLFSAGEFRIMMNKYFHSPAFVFVCVMCVIIVIYMSRYLNCLL